MRIGVASSGLGHVTRGIEAWAAYLGEALAARGEDVRLYRAAGKPTRPYERLVSCLPRTDVRTLRFVRWMPGMIAWRIGLGSVYEVEQTTFALSLLPHLRNDCIDVLHVKDPQLALIVQRANRMNLVPTRVILSHGTEETPQFLRKITYLHHLSPAHASEARAAGADKPTWRMISNFIDTDRFPPGKSPRLRRELGIPESGLIVLCAAAIKSEHKRVNYLLNEFSNLRKSDPDLPVWLIVAGGRGPDTDDLIARGRADLGNRVRFLINHPLTEMPELYRSADLFVLCSLKEMLGTVLLEAMATEVPCLVHHHESMKWVIGPGGKAIDMTRNGELSFSMKNLLSNQETRRSMGRQAREYCIEVFGKDHIVNQYLAYYRDVTRKDPDPVRS